MTKILLTSILFFTAITWAEPARDLPTLMHSFYYSLQELKPFLISLDAFKDKKNRQQIEELLTDFKKKADQAPARELQAPGFVQTYSLLGSHLRETKYLFDREIYENSWRNLRATTQLCMACHERLPKPEKSLNWMPVGEIFKKAPAEQIKEAEFLSIGHQFENALLVQNGIIKAYDKNKSEFQGVSLETIFQRKIAYFSRILRDPEQAVKSLQADLQNKKLPKEIRSALFDWIVFFQDWQNEKIGSRLENLPAPEFLKKARELTNQSVVDRKISLTDPYLARLMRLSGVLYERIFKAPKSEVTQELLYLLARCERDLAPLQGYSLADIYLKECVEMNPKKAIAEKCFADYEVAIQQKFPSGTNEYIDAGMAALKKSLH